MDIRGHERVIEVHRQKISIELDNPYPNKQALQDWQKHIRIHEREIAKLLKKLPGGE